MNPFEDDNDEPCDMCDTRVHHRESILTKITSTEVQLCSDCKDKKERRPEKVYEVYEICEMCELFALCEKVGSYSRDETVLVCGGCEDELKLEDERMIDFDSRHHH